MKQSAKWLKETIMLVSALTLFSCSVFAQGSGNIKGQVMGAEGTALPGASIIINGTTRGTTTDLSGVFELLDVKDGDYTLQVNYMGYQPAEADIHVSAGKTIVKDFTLSYTHATLKNVTISAVVEGQQKALNQQRNSDNVKQIVSADLIGRYPDLNVAESMQRLPGVTIGRNSSGEGSTIQLRGTPANFTNINVNGEQILSTQENGQRSVSLDGIPVGLLSSMEVSKTLTPDQDGDAIAGAINLKSPTATSTQTKMSADLGAGYNDLRKSLNGIGNLTLGKRFLADEKNPNGKLGVLLNGSYYRTKNGYDELNAQVWEQVDFDDGKGDIYFPTDVRYLFVENQRTRKGGSATIDYNFNSTSNIVANLMYSDYFTDIIRYRKRTRMQTKNTTVDDDGNYVTTKGRAYNEVKSGNTDNNNLNLSLIGETAIGKLKLDAGVFATNAGYKESTGTYNFITGNIPLTISDITGDYLTATGTDWRNDASLFTYNTVEREHYKTSARNFVARLNMSLPYKIGNNSATFKAGFKIKNTHSQRFYPTGVVISTYDGDATSGSLTNFEGKKDVSSSLLNGNFDFGLGVDKDKTINYFNNNQGSSDFPMDSSSIRGTTDTYFYNAIENITAGYLMNRIQFNRFMLLAGLRIEATEVDYKGNIVDEDADGLYVSTTPNRKKTNYTKFLPNLQGKYNLTNSLLLRGGITFGYSRPDFVDLVPNRLASLLAETVVDGNPDLKPAFATNFDLAIEKYLSNLGILSFNAFYKKIDDFQYSSVTTIQGSEFDNADLYLGYQWYRTLNGNTANVYGVEINAQTNLTFLPGFLKGFSILANYTYSHSQADAQYRKNIRLPGQATNTANASLAYSIKRFTIQGNLNYNGSYTVSLGADDATDVIRDSRIQIDANASCSINKKLTIYAEAVNLTNAPQVDYFGVRERIYTKQYYSFWGRAGLKFRL
ncbi:TonB-dependent receptor [Parafilimonas sp.]|uniref:TonB-dependent receptor n=1 Tax=Parafilimonas sp. TaxID=1969739 RepID=UPI0039E55B7D